MFVCQRVTVTFRVSTDSLPFIHIHTCSLSLSPLFQVQPIIVKCFHSETNYGIEKFHLKITQTIDFSVSSDGVHVFSGITEWNHLTSH